MRQLLPELLREVLFHRMDRFSFALIAGAERKEATPPWPVLLFLLHRQDAIVLTALLSTNFHCDIEINRVGVMSLLFWQAIPVQSVHCLGRCNKGPNARILTPDGTFVEVSVEQLLLIGSWLLSIFSLI